MGLQRAEPDWATELNWTLQAENGLSKFHIIRFDFSIQCTTLLPLTAHTFFQAFSIFLFWWGCLLKGGRLNSARLRLCTEAPHLHHVKDWLPRDPELSIPRGRRHLGTPIGVKIESTGEFLQIKDFTLLHYSWSKHKDLYRPQSCNWMLLATSHRRLLSWPFLWHITRSLEAGQPRVLCWNIPRKTWILSIPNLYKWPAFCFFLQQCIIPNSTIKNYLMLCFLFKLTSNPS